MQFSEEHGAFGVVFEESENEIQKTSMQGRSSVYIPGAGDGGTIDFFGDSEYKGKGRLCLISCCRTLGSLSGKETFWKLKKEKRWSQKTSRQINSKSVDEQGFEKLALRTLSEDR